MNSMKNWMSVASTAEQTRLAKIAKTSRAYLYQLASGERVASAELAQRLEVAGREMAVKNPNLPDLYQRDLCPACRTCPYSRR